MKLVVAVALLGCGSKPEPVTPVAGPPVVAWSTPSQPWRVGHYPTAMAIEGDVAMIGHDHGLITRLDLRTGKITGRAHVGGMLRIAAVVSLHDGRWLAIAEAGILEPPSRVALIIDGDTLAASTVAFPTPSASKGPDEYNASEAVLLADGGIVIVGRGLPLAIYDGKTLALRTTLDPELGWTHPHVLGNVVVADHNLKTTRFALDTKERTQISAPRAMPAANQVFVSTTTANEKLYPIIITDLARPQTKLGDAVDAVLVDATGTRMITFVKDEVQVRSLPTGEVVRRIALGASAERVSSWHPRVAFDGDRMLIDGSGVVRLIDLATGTITPAGDPPFSRGTRVSDDVGVTVFGTNAAWRLEGGKLATTTLFADLGELEAIGNRVILAKDKHAELRVLGETRPLVQWNFETEVNTAYVGTGEAIVFDTAAPDAGAPHVVRATGAKLDVMFAYSPEAFLEDVAPDRGEALVSKDGRVGVWHGKPLAFSLRIPECNNWGHAILAPTGKRAVTTSHDLIAVWDATTGSLESSAHLDRRIESVMFPPRPELLVLTDGGLVAWNPNHEARAIAMPGLVSVTLSRSGRAVVLGYDDHLELADLDALIATMKPIGAPARAEIPASCPAPDPFVIPPPDPPEPPDPSDVDDAEPRHRGADGSPSD